jgi:hypothetical protein
MLEPDLIDRIRSIFLHRRPHVSIAEATALLGWTREERTAATAADEIEITATSFGKWIRREELMAKALELWSPEAIAETVIPDADHAIPSTVRLTNLHVRIPRHHVAMLELFAERDHTTVSHVLIRELDGIASANSEELSWTIPGFADALEWPDAEGRSGHAEA